MIHELLSIGAENARTGRELATLLGCDIRTITEQIERERRDGQPICATPTGENAGYFLAENTEQLQNYCDRLKHRADELNTTRRALLAVLKQLPGVVEKRGSDGKR